MALAGGWRSLAAGARDGEEAEPDEAAAEDEEDRPHHRIHAIRSSALLGKPAHHDVVEDLGMLDIGEVAGVGDLLVATAGDELGDPLVAGGRRAGIVIAAH